MDPVTVTCDVCGTKSGVPYEQYWQFSLSGGKCMNCGKKMISKTKTAQNTPIEFHRGDKPAGINNQVQDAFL